MVRKKLFIGAMQSGKTTHVVNQACGNKTGLQIPAFCNFTSKISMESANEKILKHNVNLVSGLDTLRHFKHRVHRDKLNSNEKYVLSFLQHHDHLSEVRNIATSFDPKYYDTYNILPIFDEDDVLAFGHTPGRDIIQKRREAHALLSDLPLVKKSWHVTATYFANTLGELSFEDGAEKIIPGERYKSIQQISDKLEERWIEKDIHSLATEPSRKIINYIQDESYTGLDLIQTVRTIPEQYAIVENLVKYTEDSIIAVANSGDRPTYYFSNGTTYGTNTESFNRYKLFKLAEENNIKRVFVVSYFLSDRTNTFRADEGIFSEMRSVLHTSRNVNSETILQRAGRLCGYEDNVPLLTCTPQTADALYRAVDDFDTLENMPLDVLADKDLRYEYLEDHNLNLNYLRDTNGFKNRKKGKWYTTEKPKGECISTIHTGEVEVLTLSLENTDFNSNRPLKEYFKKKYKVNTVLNCNDTKRVLQLRPNTETEIQKHRELGVQFTGGRKYKCIRQDWNVYPENKKYCMHNFEGTYDCHPNNDGATQ